MSNKTRLHLAEAVLTFIRDIGWYHNNNLHNHARAGTIKNKFYTNESEKTSFPSLSNRYRGQLRKLKDSNILLSMILAPVMMVVLYPMAKQANTKRKKPLALPYLWNGRKLGNTGGSKPLNGMDVLISRLCRVEENRRGILDRYPSKSTKINLLFLLSMDKNASLLSEVR